MKKKLSILFLLIISVNLSAQVNVISKKIFLDSLNREATPENYSYSRIITNYSQTSERYVVTDYYKNGRKKMIGNSLDKDILKKDGQFVYYFNNGSKESVITYDDDHKIGKEFNWYENQNIKSEKENFWDPKTKTAQTLLLNFWNNNKEQIVTDGNGEYENTTEKIVEKGTIKNGLKQGVWQGNDLIHKVTFTENYNKGNLLSGISTDENNIKHSYSIVAEKPVPENGIDVFYTFIAKNYKTPSEAFANKVIGKIYVTFVVNKNGKIENPEVLKDLGYGTGEEAIRVLNSAEKWIPGKYRGIPTSAIYSLPITIRSR